MDFISNHFLQKEGIPQVTVERYYEIYQQLGMAWEFLGLQCQHGDGYKKIREGKEACRICGKIKGAGEFYYLLPHTRAKRIGRRIRPNSRKNFPNEKQARLLKDRILFHGAELTMDVHNAYKSTGWSKDLDINIAADRIVQLKERGLGVWIDQYLVSIKLPRKAKSRRKLPREAFVGELRKKDLRNFPVLFEFDEKFRFLGITILT